MTWNTFAFGEKPISSTKMNQNFRQSVFSLVPIAQMAYQIIEVANFTNRNYLYAELFNADTGKANTVTAYVASYNDTSDYFALGPVTDYSGDSTADDGFTNPTYAFDSNDTTFASYTGDFKTAPITLGKTFSAKTITSIKVKFEIARGSAEQTGVLVDTYNGATWDTIRTYNNVPNDTVYTRYINIDSSVQGVRVSFQAANFTTGNTAKLYLLEYGTTYKASDTVTCTNLIALSGTERFIAVYARNNLTGAGTSMTFDITDGSTTLSSQVLDEPIDISSLSSGNATITFNLATSTAANSPKFYGYGIALFKDD